MSQMIIDRLTSKKMDQETIKQQNISSLELMEKAGENIYKILIDNKLIKNDHKILVLSGPGNNGGDGIFVAKKLLENKFQVTLFNSETKTEESTKILSEFTKNHKYIKHPNFEFLETFDDYDVIIDCLFGTGLNKELKGEYYDIINAVNNSKAIVIALDIASGLNADNGKVMSIAIKANYTICIDKIKQGQLINDGLDYSGLFLLTNIELSEVTNDFNTYYLNNLEYDYKFKKRLHNSHKYNYGFVHVIGGKKGMMGAPVLAAYSALKTGSGLSSISYRETDINHIMNIYPEIMTNTYKNIEELIPQLYKKDVVIFGVGMGKTDDENFEILEQLLTFDKKILIDADGLFYLKPLIEKYKNKEIIITPHFKELSNLLDISIKELSDDPVYYVKQIITKYNITCLLKGPSSIIGYKNDIYFSSYGSPALATLGSGDVLSGIIASIYARSTSPLDATIKGHYIHALAASIATQQFNVESVSASDVMANISNAINQIM
ncbi:hypothetical protein CI105_06725 [Candidatus Izimaplasma bacterium ZiA1]|uniref:NAD(P)H-hydrate dehydratase n=1 Tax=Candidatus Izimoplasma sp. ZiA1 TaxID=2024899 RepID=UPI000BAA5E33|nr:hypothetical protein CI105_06725 [Candidatus Izimaplasma bacterium ZiA1]